MQANRPLAKTTRHCITNNRRVGSAGAYTYAASYRAPHLHVTQLHTVEVHHTQGICRAEAQQSQDLEHLHSRHQRAPAAATGATQQQHDAVLVVGVNLVDCGANIDLEAQ
jgi:hypothetical protein